MLHSSEKYSHHPPYEFLFWWFNRNCTKTTLQALGNGMYYSMWPSDEQLVRVAILYTLYNSNANKLKTEEHTSELQSRFDLVCRLLLEKKKKINNYLTNIEEDIE